MGRPKGSKNKPKESKSEKKVQTIEAAPVEEKVETPSTPEVARPRRAEPAAASEPFTADPKAVAERQQEVKEAMERFTKEVDADDPDLISKWASYFKTCPGWDQGINW
jgi:hypothetical protein